MPMKTELTVSSETSATRTQAPGNYPIRNILKRLYSRYSVSYLRHEQHQQQQPQRISNPVLFRLICFGRSIFSLVEAGFFCRSECIHALICERVLVASHRILLPLLVV